MIKNFGKNAFKWLLVIASLANLYDTVTELGPRISAIFTKDQPKEDEEKK